MGAEVEGSGRNSRDAVHRTAVVAGVGIGVLPGALVLVLYLPVRSRWRRDVRAVADALADSAGDPAFERYLARRAVAALAWDEVRGVAPDPWGALDRGDVRALADAELSRLGLSRPA
jgi:phosphate starvation-inducible protein PhoH